MRKKAYLYRSLENGSVICDACAHRCVIKPGKNGICNVRTNDGGALYSLVYGRLIAEHIDPIEKKPLKRFLPSSRTYSVASAGCNFKCAFCQNWEISQASGLRADDMERHGRVSLPQTVVERALEFGCESVSYTYTEPTVYSEFVADTAEAARASGLKNVLVSNGYMTDRCLELMGRHIDACNVDLKSFRDGFYKKHCGASLQPVLDSLKAIRGMGIWLEVTTLVIPGENDSAEELADIAGFIAGSLGADTPWHVSRFFPRYMMADMEPTEVKAIKKAAEIGGRAGLKYVYAGNI